MANSAGQEAVLQEYLQRLLPRILIDRLGTDENKSKSKLVIGDSWKEEFQGACGLFDISGFSRLAAHLSKVENSKTEAEKTSLQRKRNSVAYITNDSDIVDMLRDQAQTRGKGAEELAGFISTFFGDLVDAIHSSGGDIIKFAGDCLICVWEHRPTDGCSLGQTVYNAARCGFQLKDKVTLLEDASKLSVHICVGAGSMTLVSLSACERSECFVLGDGYIEALSGIEVSKSGQIVLSQGGYAHLLEAIPSNVHGQSSVETSTVSGSDHMLLTRLDDTLFDEPLVIRHLHGIVDSSLEVAKTYVPKNVLQLLSVDDFQSYLREVTVVFVNFHGVEDLTLFNLDRLYKSVMGCVDTEGATLKEFTVDDKGAVAVIALGFPGGVTGLSDFAGRAIRVALYIREKAALLGVFVGIGIATGMAYCGMIGSNSRCNYGAVGAMVNLSARFMGRDGQSDGRIIVHSVTTREKSASLNFRFSPLAPMACKGFDELVEAFTPSGRIEQVNVFNPDAAVFVARKNVLGLLHKAANTDGLTLLESCESGVGGTTCLAELIGNLEGTNNLICLGAGTAKSSQAHAPLKAVMSALQCLVAIDEGEPLVEIHADKNNNFLTSSALCNRTKTTGDTLEKSFSLIDLDQSREIQESIASIRKMLPNLIVPEGHKPNSNRYLMELTKFCLYNSEDSIKLGLAVKTIVEWKTSGKYNDSKEAYDRVVFVLDDLHLFDYESLTVLSAIVQANIPKLSIVACVHKNAKEPLVRSQQARKNKRLGRSKTINASGRQLADAELGKRVYSLETEPRRQDYLYSEWHEDAEARKRLLRLVSLRKTSITLHAFTAEESKRMIQQRYGQHIEIEDDVFRRLLDLGGNLPSSMLDLIETWVETGVLVWSLVPFETTRETTEHANISTNTRNRTNKWGRRRSGQKVRSNGTLKIQTTRLQWNIEENVNERGLDLPAQIKKYYLSLLQQMDSSCRELVELMSCFPGDIKLHYLIVYELMQDRKVERKTTKTLKKQSTFAAGHSAPTKNTNHSVRRESTVNAITKTLNQLLKENIVAEISSAEGDCVYRFRQSALHRTTYESMLFSKRKQMHHKLVQVFKSMKDDDQAVAHLILFNAEKAQAYDELLVCFWEQGVQKQLERDNAAAFVAYSQALALLSEYPQEIEFAIAENNYKILRDTSKTYKPLTIARIEDVLQRRLACVCMRRGDLTTAKKYTELVIHQLENQEKSQPARRSALRNICFDLSCTSVRTSVYSYIHRTETGGGDKWRHFLECIEGEMLREDQSKACHQTFTNIQMTKNMRKIADDMELYVGQPLL